MSERTASVKVEFYGIVRARCAVAETVVELPESRSTLGALIDALSRRFPGLAETCFDGDRLGRGFTANVDGQRFVTSPETRLSDGEVVLLMSADAGG